MTTTQKDAVPTKTVSASAVTPESQAKEMVNSYMVKDKIMDFSTVPTHHKLTLLQKTPTAFIKERKIGRNMIPYVEHSFAEKALNLVFNFNVSNEVMEKEFREYTETYYDYDTKEKKTRNVIEAECMVKFTFRDQAGNQIVRTVYSSQKQYPNSAITRGDAMKGAISKAWTIVARTFGIGSDLKDAEEKAYREVEELEPQQPAAKPAKTFTPNY